MTHKRHITSIDGISTNENMVSTYRPRANGYKAMSSADVPEEADGDVLIDCDELTVEDIRECIREMLHSVVK